MKCSVVLSPDKKSQGFGPRITKLQGKYRCHFHILPTFMTVTLRECVLTSYMLDDAEINDLHIKFLVLSKLCIQVGYIYVYSFTTALNDIPFLFLRTITKSMKMLLYYLQFFLHIILFQTLHSCRV